jgi:inhibitor of KinA sporulation pathway (predicted exonuclease)
MAQQKFDYFVVLDFEATCDATKTPSYTQEIIEFPSVLISTSSSQPRVVSTFQKYVKPIVAVLSNFCTELTGIQQAQVDHGVLFAKALQLHKEWLWTHINKASFVLVTCGDWDLASMLPRQVKLLDSTKCPSIPACYKKWINIKKTFKTHTKTKPGSMMDMLAALNLAHVGRHHSGIDDCVNIANIVMALINDGAVLDITSWS